VLPAFRGGKQLHLHVRCHCCNQHHLHKDNSMTTLFDLRDVALEHTDAQEAIEGARLRLHKAMLHPRSDDRPEHLMLRRDLPYAIRPTWIEGTSILVNCEGWPIGSTAPGEMTDESYENSHVRLTIHQVASLSPDQDRLGQLFEWGAPPWSGMVAARAYRGRLNELIRLIGTWSRDGGNA